jgi:CRP/FNR family transcriptional regulator, dissimilatory nitrate respiration regulator
MTELASRLQALRLFHDLDQKSIRALADRARVRQFKPGDMILREQEKKRGLFVILKGRIKVFRVLGNGREQTIYVFESGEPFCLCAMFAGQHQPASASALEQCEILEISEQDFQRIARDEPSLLLAMLSTLSRRLKEAMDIIESLSSREIPPRVATYLLKTSSTAHDGAQVVNLSMTHRELAKVVGATPEALSRAFRKMSANSLVRLSGREVFILDSSGLERLAWGGE